MSRPYACGGAKVSHLVGVHEEFDKLAAHHSEQSGLGVIQRQAGKQLTAGLVEVQQPPHKPGMKQQRIILLKFNTRR